MATRTVRSAIASLCMLAGAGPAPRHPKVVVVRMIRDEAARTYFEPDEPTVQPGDTLRFVEVAGMHNVDFPPDSNPAGTALPKPTAMVDTPGATLDVVIRLAPGRYYFRCDPHAERGMVGHLTVRPRTG